MTPATMNRILATAAGLALLAGAPAHAAMSVTPVIVDMSTAGNDASAVVTVDNTFDSPVPVALSTSVAEAGDSGLTDTAKPSDDLLVFPPQAIIQPGKTQAFRIQYVGEPDIKKSRHYFVTVNQLPVKLPDGTSGVQVLYEFQVVVNVGAAGARPHLTIARTEIDKAADGKFHPVIYVTNDAAMYGYLSRGHLKITETDPTGKQVFSKSLISDEIQDRVGPGLVVTGQTRRFEVPMDLPSGEGKVNAIFAQDED